MSLASHIAGKGIGPEIQRRRQVLLNKATRSRQHGGGGAESNWAVPGSLPTFAASLTSRPLDRRRASVDIFGFVVGTRHLQHDPAGPVVTGNAALGTVSGAAVAGSRSATSACSPASVRRSTTTAATPADDTVDLNNAVGFSIRGGSVAMAMVRPATANAADKSGYLRHGDIAQRSRTDRHRQPDPQGRRHRAGQQDLDCAGVATSASTGSAQRQRGHPAEFAAYPKLTKDVALAIDGRAAIDLFGFIVGSADARTSKPHRQRRPERQRRVLAGRNDLGDATLLNIGLTNLNLFVGVGGSWEPTACRSPAGRPASVSAGSLGLAIVKANPVPSPATTAPIGHHCRNRRSRELRRPPGRHQHQGGPTSRWTSIAPSASVPVRQPAPWAGAEPERQRRPTGTVSADMLVAGHQHHADRQLHRHLRQSSA